MMKEQYDIVFQEHKVEEMYLLFFENEDFDCLNKLL